MADQTKTAKVELTLEYSAALPWDDVSVRVYVERALRIQGEVKAKVTKVEVYNA